MEDGHPVRPSTGADHDVHRGLVTERGLQSHEGRQRRAQTGGHGEPDIMVFLGEIACTNIGCPDGLDDLGQGGHGGGSVQVGLHVDFLHNDYA